MDGAMFPVVYYDGEKEIPMGSVLVGPSSMNVKRFHALVKEKIGIDNGQVSVYLADRKGSRVPLTNRVNLSAFCREEGAWYFLAILEGSTSPNMKGRRRRRSPFNNLDHVTLLRRDANAICLGILNSTISKERSAKGTMICDDCLKEDVEFHRCVNDAVTFRFRSRAGPIARPMK